jgi:hypothetical protein
MDRSLHTRLICLIYRLRWNPRLLASPLLGLVVCLFVVGGAALHWLRGEMIIVASHLTIFLTVVIAARAWEWSVTSGLARDWRLAGGDLRLLDAAIMRPPWFAWWAAVSLVNLMVSEYGRLPVIPAAPPGSSFVTFHTPGAVGFGITGREGEDLWSFISWQTTFLLTPALVALWAYALRWLCEAAFVSARRPGVGLILALVVILPVRVALREGFSGFQQSVSLRLQGVWPLDWSLPARLFLGLYLGWLALPAALIALALLARWWTVRRRTRWWEGIE